MYNFKVGFVSLGKQYGFNLDLAGETRKKSIDLLNGVEGLSIVNTGDLVITEAEAEKTIEKFKNNNVDQVVIQSGTFSSGEVFMKFAKAFDGPFLLWGIPEPEIKENIKLNSLCGVNLHASLLSNLDKEYKYIYGNPTEEKINKELVSWFKVNSLKEDLKDLNVGLFGSHTPGFYTFGINELKLRKKVGPRITHIDLSKLFHKAESHKGEDTSDFDSELNELSDNYEEIPRDKKDQYSQTYKSFRDIIDEFSLDAVAVKCWPEFIEDYGQAACATLSKLTNDNIVTGCEGDVLGTVTSYILRELGDNAPFIADLVQIEQEENTGVMWHCGVAPFCQAHSESPVKIGEEFGIGGINVEFAMQPGEVTIARLSMNKGNYRLLITSGEAVNTTETPDGTAAVVKFDPDINEVLDTIIYGGYEHHLSMIYADVKEELIELGSLLDIETVVLE
ncbi:MAG: L-fucose/L-arabinose isomerase family protein [Halanaerobiales bacterium]|nr:L-fucose/L-arabinose isomerase family protein [Halanaerobiales bacterium]